MHLPFPSSAGSAPQGSCVDPRPTSNPASPFTPLLQGRTHLTTHLKTASKKPPRHRKQLVPWGGNSGRTGCRSAGVAWGRWGPAGLPWILSADCLGGLSGLVRSKSPEQSPVALLAVAPQSSPAPVVSPTLGKHLPKFSVVSCPSAWGISSDMAVAHPLIALKLLLKAHVLKEASSHHAYKPCLGSMPLPLFTFFIVRTSIHFLG